MKTLRLTIALLAVVLLAPAVFAKEPVTVFIAGDSTAAPKLETKRPETGWGEQLQKHFDEHKVRVDNHAANGRSTKTFIGENRWQAILDKLKPGDFISYYAKARDASNETTSDIYFIEVKPFEMQYKQSQAQQQSGGGQGEGADQDRERMTP